MSMKWVSRTIAMLAVVLAGMSLMLKPAQADDILRYRVTSVGGNMYAYWKFSNTQVTVQANDCIEYDVYLHTSRAGVGGIDICNTDNSAYRDQPGWVDQNGVSGHPATDLRAYAYRKWYHRKLTVPTTMVGWTINLWDVAVDHIGWQPYETVSAMYNNVKVTRGTSTIATAYADGSPSLNVLHFSTASTVQAASLIPTTPRKQNAQVAGHFFYWHDAPEVSHNADPSQYIYDPRGFINTGAWTGYGSNGYYSSENTDWWEGEFQDMKRAGFDIACMVNWGPVPDQPWRWNAVFADHMVPALERSGVDIKVALFDDTTSECLQWNYNNGRGYWFLPPFPLSDVSLWGYFYNQKIKPFYDAIPRKFWATHNGLPVDQGGRPIIVTWSSEYYTDREAWSNAMWSTIKNQFAMDFEDANGNGIVPWLIHEASWVFHGAEPSADGVDAWGSALVGPSIFTINNNGYYVGNIGWGCDDHIIRNPPTIKDRQYGNWLVGEYGKDLDAQVLMQNPPFPKRKLWDCNLILVETWNELFEGTAMDRCVDYPAPGGGSLPETYYIDKFGKDCVTASIGRREWDATFLRTWTVPTTLMRGTTTASVTVRNDGLLPWDPNNAQYPVRMGMWLEDASGNEIAGTSARAYNYAAVTYAGDEVTYTWTTPANWPTGTYYLRLDMIAEMYTWFKWQGDTPVKIQVTIQ